MSIERLGGRWVAVCDICGDELDGEDNYLDAIRVWLAADWESQLTAEDWEDWEDICPNCQEVERE